MKKIKLFSAEKIIGIEGANAELYINFYLVLNRKYIFTFLIDAPNLACSGKNPIRLWKRFLMLYEEECVIFMMSYERLLMAQNKVNKDLGE